MHWCNNVLQARVDYKTILTNNEWSYKSLRNILLVLDICIGFDKVFQESVGEKSESADFSLSLIPVYALFNFRRERQQHGTTTNSHSFWSEYEETKSVVLVPLAHFSQSPYRWENSHLPRFSSHTLTYKGQRGSIGDLLIKTFSEKMSKSNIFWKC